jgi:hypothetical protein
MVKTNNSKHFNTKVDLVDCSYSKKRKKMDIEYFSLYEAKVAALEDDGVICRNQNPPAGAKDKFTTSNGVEIVSIVPHFTECPDLDECHPNKPNVWHEYRKPVFDNTIVPMLDYHNYLVDPEYIKLLHSRVNGLIRAWRIAVDECISSMHCMYGYSWKALSDQYDWYKTQTEPIMEALSSFHLMPISHMNARAAQSLIRGINCDEQADFAIRLGQCKRIGIAVIRHTDKNNVSIVTIFDQDYKYKVAYGKISIEDLRDEEPEKPIKLGRSRLREKVSENPVNLFDTSKYENIIVCPKSCECGGKGEHSICNK